MGSFSRLQKIAVLSLGVGAGALVYYQLNRPAQERKLIVSNSWTTNYTPSVKWDNNWDHRNPTSLVKPAARTPEDDNRFNTELECNKSKAVRHIFLIRHGQYIEAEKDVDRKLTELGRVQADLTGKRLALLGIKWDLLIRSTMTRAQETAKIIATHLPADLEVKDCALIEEGAPIPPEPPVGHWKPEPQQFFQDSARIEAGFRKYFHRASPKQEKDSYTIIVCHANVIRFIVCKALQFPPEAWLRISLSHGSITWLSIHPNGNVVLRSLSDVGYMDPQCITSRNKFKRPSTAK